MYYSAGSLSPSVAVTLHSMFAFGRRLVPASLPKRCNQPDLYPGWLVASCLSRIWESHDAAAPMSQCIVLLKGVSFISDAFGWLTVAL